MSRPRMSGRLVTLLFAVCLGCAYPLTAAAQQPICAEPSPDKTYYTACTPGGRIIATRLLWDLTVDHVLKPEPFSRHAINLFEFMVRKTTRESNGDLEEYLRHLEPAKFTRLETATGLVKMSVPETARTFASTVQLGDDRYDVSWRLPTTIAGGYWRTPGVLQIAFWEGSRATVSIKAPNGVAIDADVACLVLSPDGLRILTASKSAPDVLVQFASCG